MVRPASAPGARPKRCRGQQRFRTYLPAYANRTPSKRTTRHAEGITRSICKLYLGNLSGGSCYTFRTFRCQLTAVCIFARACDIAASNFADCNFSIASRTF